MKTRTAVAVIALAALVSCTARSEPVRGPDDRGMHGQRAHVPSRRGASADAGEAGTLAVAGQTRSYYLHRPSGASAESLPLVIVFHGGGGDASTMAAQTGFNEVADRNGFAVAYPESIQHWNDGRDATAQYGDDTSFTSALIDQLIETEGIDRTRVYVTGASNGGMMTIRLACERADEIAAFAAVAASFPDTAMSRCRPARPVPMLIILGSEDPAVRTGGATIRGGRRPGGTVTPMADTLEFWRRTDGCQTGPRIKTLPDATNDGTNIKVAEYSGCTPGVALIYMEIVGGGHTWPGARENPRTTRVGRVSHDIDGSQYIWDFFKQYQLPTSR
jgi:polyhydroxybutyrate depolymerase